MALLLITLLSSLVTTKELLINGDFEEHNTGWYFFCQENPICNGHLCDDNFSNNTSIYSHGGYFLRLRDDCYISQKVASGGYLKFEASSPNFTLDFGDQAWLPEKITMYNISSYHMSPFDTRKSGTSIYIYEGKADCPREWGCLLRIDFRVRNFPPGTRFYLDNFSLSEQLDQKENITDADTNLVIWVILVLAFGLIAGACFNLIDHTFLLCFLMRNHHRNLPQHIASQS